MTPEAPHQPQGIQTIEIAGDILKVVAQSPKPLSITELSLHCGMSKSKLHKYLVSLCRIGLLTKGRDLRYSLGTELMLLGLTAVERIDIRSQSLPYVLELNDKLGETAALAIWGEGGPFFLLWQESHRTVNIGIKAGSRVGLTHSATGLLFAAFMPSDRVRALLDQEIAARGLTASEVEDTLEQVRSQGYAVAKGDLIPGIAAVAAPVFGPGMDLAACLTVVGILGTMPVGEDSPILHSVRDSARRLSYELGHVEAKWRGN